MQRFAIRTPSVDAAVATLSGGNQQKVALARWLVTKPGVLIVDEPTQGVDIGAKAQIHALVRKFAADGGGVLVSSSDLAELALMCEAVLAFHHGHIAERIERSELHEPRLHAAIGG